MKSFKIILTLATVCVVILLACKKEQPGMQNAEDPCECASEVSADFVIEELATHIPKELWIETDTTLHDKRVRFRALEEDAEYTWYIGLDVETDQAPWKYFSDQWSGQDISITLVVKKEPNNTCFPEDDGYDSITKTFHVSQYPIYPDVMNTDPIIYHGGISGTYRMYHKDLNDSIDIKVELKRENSVLARVVNFENLDGFGLICNDTLEENVHRGIGYMAYRELEIKNSGSTEFCGGLSGIIRNKIDGTAEMDLVSKMIINPPSGPTNDVYLHLLGRKIN